MNLTYSLCVAQTTNQISEMEENIELARIMIPQKRYEDAINLLTTVIRDNPNNYQAYLLRSQAKYSLKDYLGALNDSQNFLT